MTTSADSPKTAETSLTVEPSDKNGESRDAQAHPFPIVAIGASAGGLEVLEQFLSHAPLASGMAFVVIQHLDPEREGMLPELLQRVTAMPVAQARHRMQVKPDCVYVIPPNRDMSIQNDSLYLLERAAPHGLHLPIDSFFRALAANRHENAVGVILSGMGADGALGLRAIKEYGGLVLAQDPAAAKFDSMPRNAIDTGLVDIVAAACDLPQRIADTFHHAAEITAAAPKATDATESDESRAEAHKSAFDTVCALLQARTGHDFSLYKKSTVYRRVERRMALHRLDRIADYARYLADNPQEGDLLFKELLIGVTSFFRDPPSWVYLQESVLPALLATLPAGAALRAWVVGCSSGEEAYSLAIAFRETQDRLSSPGRYSLQIFATDLATDAIDKGRRGVYPAAIADDVSQERLERFFVQESNGYRVNKEIRSMVVFAPQNAIMDPPFTKLDILVCRNLLIYFSLELQKKLLPLFHYSLKPGGVLMLGGSESIGAFSDLFAPLEAKVRLFRRRSSRSSSAELEFPSRYAPTKTTALIDAAPAAPTAVNLQKLADQVLLQQFAPAAVLITGDGDLLYVSGRTGKYLEPAAGKSNWNIHAMARAGLRHQLALALPKALRSRERVIYRNLRVETDGGAQWLDLALQAIDEPAALRGTVMVMFTDVAAPALAATPAIAVGKPLRRSSRVAELEQSLERMRQEMQAFHEEMQTSHEELRSANEELQSTIEELQSTNEELQSTNEEITTSKEEMQSLNEELQSVNIELQSKVDELSTVNLDMKNLLDSTDLATVFLDGALRLRRFTTQATRLFRLIPGDIGRPLFDIANDLIYPEIEHDIETVLRTAVAAEREIATGDQRWFQVKIMPYRNLHDIAAGVVMTFADIGRAKRLEAQLRLDSGQTKERP